MGDVQKNLTGKKKKVILAKMKVFMLREKMVGYQLQGKLDWKKMLLLVEQLFIGALILWITLSLDLVGDTRLHKNINFILNYCMFLIKI